MKANTSEQSSVWQAAFAEGLARGEAAFGESNGDALRFAESYAYLVEAEHQKASAIGTPSRPSLDNASTDTVQAGWARAFGNSQERPEPAGRANEAEATAKQIKTGWAKAFGRIAY